MSNPLYIGHMVSGVKEEKPANPLESLKKNQNKEK
jgi:hypothetical protein